MSFILDALRKSDTERQQQATPGLATTAQRTRDNRSSIWMPLLVIVLILNAAVFVWIYVTDTSRPENVRATAPSPPEQSAPRSDTRSLQREADTPDLATKVAPPAATREPAARPATEAAVASTPPPVFDESPPAAVTPPEPDTASIRPALPSFEQLLAGGIISVEPLHLDIHVFSGEPAKRFVFINMKKYREGERLSEGPVVEEITSDGVVLNHQGSRFTLERS